MLHWKLSEPVLRLDSQDTKHLLSHVIILEIITFSLPQLSRIEAVAKDLLLPVSLCFVCVGFHNFFTYSDCICAEC